MKTSSGSGILAAPEHARLAALLAAVPAPRRWAVTHMHAPLLCVLELIDAPDAGYAHAARRRFANPVESRRRALALIAELDGYLRRERFEQGRRGRE